MAEQQWEIKVSGRVQGVGFRYFIQRKANDFNIKGWVRNTHDGGIHILAEGEIIDLETFSDWIKQGPPLSRVLSVLIDRFEKITGFSSFEIKY
jgi:acylphosphatase